MAEYKILATKLTPNRDCGNFEDCLKIKKNTFIFLIPIT